MPVTVVSAGTVSQAWDSAVRAARHAAGHRLFHLVVNISDPLVENVGTRQEVDALLARLRLQPVDTVANTIMPARLAARFTNHADLVWHYRQDYARILKFPGNNWGGTYFGRLVAYPIGYGRRPPPVDQLDRVIADLSTSRVVAAQYETVIATPEEEGEDDPQTTPALIHHATRGRRGRGGPCLSHVAFQREGGRVHAVAHYRSQVLIERAYGNYLGLGRLLRYVASQAGLAVGELTVVAGYAMLDQPMNQIDQTLAAIAGLPDTG